VNGQDQACPAVRLRYVGIYQSNIRALNARPDATRSEFDTLVEQFDKQRITVRSRLLELHSQMIAATTEAEWKELSPYEQRLLTETEER